MLEILQYSMNAVFPILLLIVLGYYAKRAGMLSEQTIAQINRFNFRYGYFCLMFVNIYGVDLKEGLPVTMIALVLGIIALLTVVGWVAASFLTKERSRKGVLIQASFRSNYAIIGMMMAQALAGDEGAALVAIFQLPAVLYYNSVSVLAMSIYSDSGNKPTVGSVMKSMAQNPLIRGILTALVVIVVRFFLPVGADGQPVFTIARDLPWLLSTMTHLSRMASPLALICLGANLKISEASWSAESSCVWSRRRSSALRSYILRTGQGSSLSLLRSSRCSSPCWDRRSPLLRPSWPKRWMPTQDLPGSSWSGRAS